MLQPALLTALKICNTVQKNYLNVFFEREVEVDVQLNSLIISRVAKVTNFIVRSTVKKVTFTTRSTTNEGGKEKTYKVNHKSLRTETERFVSRGIGFKSSTGGRQLLYISSGVWQIVPNTRTDRRERPTSRDI